MGNIKLTVSYLRHKLGKFVFPDVENVAIVNLDDVELALPKPILSGGTARSSHSYKFPVDLSFLM